MEESVGLILAKGSSKRLPGKNMRDFHGEPMFMVNVKKCLKVFNRTYVSSDDNWILDRAEAAGAIPIKRDTLLCGETPNILVYKHALPFMNGCNIIVAVQANSPTIDLKLIQLTKTMMEYYKLQELMTCHKDYRIYGSIWALTRQQLEKYGDPYKPKPEILLLDPSTDIHTEEDLNEALKYAKRK
jgi:CMP-N-acetylneuraminic acid synthetase